MRLQGTSNRGTWTAVVLILLALVVVAFLYFYTAGI
jgi:hypothetical protein